MLERHADTAGDLSRVPGISYLVFFAGVMLPCMFVLQAMEEGDPVSWTWSLHFAGFLAFVAAFGACVSVMRRRLLEAPDAERLLTFPVPREEILLHRWRRLDGRGVALAVWGGLGWLMLVAVGTRSVVAVVAAAALYALLSRAVWCWAGVVATVPRSRSFDFLPVIACPLVVIVVADPPQSEWLRLLFTLSPAGWMTGWVEAVSRGGGAVAWTAAAAGLALLATVGRRLLPRAGRRLEGEAIASERARSDRGRQSQPGDGPIALLLETRLPRRLLAAWKVVERRPFPHRSEGVLGLLALVCVGLALIARASGGWGSEEAALGDPSDVVFLLMLGTAALSKLLPFMDQEAGPVPGNEGTNGAGYVRHPLEEIWPLREAETSTAFAFSFTKAMAVAAVMLGALAISAGWWAAGRWAVAGGLVLPAIWALSSVQSMQLVMRPPERELRQRKEGNASAWMVWPFLLSALGGTWAMGWTPWWTTLPAAAGSIACVLLAWCLTAPYRRRRADRWFDAEIEPSSE